MSIVDSSARLERSIFSHLRKESVTPQSSDQFNHDAVEKDEMDAQAFVIKIWSEGRSNQRGKVIWRGHITHVFEGKRRYFQDLDSIIAFIIPYLDRIGVKKSLYWRFRFWLMHYRKTIYSD